jgi:hypothetical protein
MAEYSRTEQLNELSRIFRGQIEPVKDGGVVDPDAIHAQVMEIAKTVFLLNPGAFFYLARIVRNSLLVVLRQEVAIIEDMLIAIDDLSRAPQASGGLIGEVGPNELSNAETALLALEFADTVEGRPELARYQKTIDRFTELFRQNVTDGQGRFILPRGEARQVLQTNLANLKLVHDRLLVLVDAVADLVSEYNALDVPSQVSQTALINIRQGLVDLQTAIETSTDEDLITNSRVSVLRALSGKVVVALLDQFTVVDPSAPKLTSTNQGSAKDPDAPDGEAFTLQAAGEGVAAEVFTAPGPFILDDLDSGLLELKIDGGAIQSFDLSVIQGPGLHGKNAAPFDDEQLFPTYPPLPGPWGGPTDPPPPPAEDFAPKPNLHLLVDKSSYEWQATNFGYTHNDGSYVAPEDAPHGTPSDPKPPAPDNNPPPSNIPDGTLSSGTSPRVYPAPINPGEPSQIANAVGTQGDLISDYYNAVQMSPSIKLGFKHLGGILFFQLGEVPTGTPSPAQAGAGFGGWNVDSDDTLEDAAEWENIEDRRWPYLFRPRTIQELTALADITITHDTGNRYTAAPGTFKSGWVGFYVRVKTQEIPPDAANTWERYEIFEVESGGGAAIIDTRDDAPGSAAFSTYESVRVFGTRGDYTQVTFFPDLLADTHDVGDTTGATARGPFNIPSTVTVKMGPVVKTTGLDPGDGATIAATLAALKDPANGNYDSTDNPYQHASYHCIFKEQTGFNGKITVQSRTRLIPDDNHLLQIAGGFFKTKMFLPPVGAGIHNVVQPGAGDGLLTAGPAHLPNVMVLTAASATFGLGTTLPLSVGNYVDITGASVGVPPDTNNGRFPILAVISATVVWLINPYPVLPFPDPNNPVTWAEIGKGNSHTDTLPGPDPMVTVEDSGHEVFGFGLAQRVDETLDPYLSIEELDAVVSDSISDAEVEIVETDLIIDRTLRTVAASFDIIDEGGLDFASLGVGFGYTLEILEGDNAGVYFVDSAAGSTLSLARPPRKSDFGFVGNETEVPYRVYIQRYRIASLNSGPGSSVEIVTAPSQVLALGTTVGTVPEVEAVNDAGESLSLAGLSAGDFSGSLVVSGISVDGLRATVDGGVSSSLVNLRFAFSGQSETLLNQMTLDLEVIRRSRALLGLHNFNQNLDKLDAAMSALVTPGQSFQANQNQARRLLADLLGVLTDTPRRDDEYSASIPEFEKNIEGSISSYTAPAVPALDTLLDALRDHQFDRALSLLISGQLEEFFSTTALTASFSGALLQATQDVARDVPSNTVLQEDVEDEINTADAFEPDVDADVDFSDTEGDFLDQV